MSVLYPQVLRQAENRVSHTRPRSYGPESHWPL